MKRICRDKQMTAVPGNVRWFLLNASSIPIKVRLGTLLWHRVTAG